MKTIQLNQLTEKEQMFVRAAVKNWNDLMFGDDIESGLPKASLGGVMSSLVEKNIIEMDNYERKDAQSFQFIGEDGDADYDDRPVLI